MANCKTHPLNLNFFYYKTGKHKGKIANVNSMKFFYDNLGNITKTEGLKPKEITIE